MTHPLLELEERGDWDGLVARLRDMVAEDRRTLADPIVKQWLGRRWRNLFIAEAVKDDKALEVASRPIGLLPVKRPSVLPDKATPQQRIAERYLKGDTVSDWRTELPPAQMPSVTRTTMVIAPGLLTGLLNEFAFAFLHEAPVVSAEYGWPIIRADLHSFRGCEPNHDDLLATLDRGEGFDAAMEPITDPDDLLIQALKLQGAENADKLIHHIFKLGLALWSEKLFKDEFGSQESLEDFIDMVKKRDQEKSSVANEQ